MEMFSAYSAYSAVKKVKPVCMRFKKDEVKPNGKGSPGEGFGCCKKEAV